MVSLAPFNEDLKSSMGVITMSKSWQSEVVGILTSVLCVQGQATDIAIQAEEILKLKRQINHIYAKHTGQPLETIGRIGQMFIFPLTPTFLLDGSVLLEWDTTHTTHSVYVLQM